MACLFLMCSDSCYHGEQVFPVSKVLCVLVAPKVSTHIYQESSNVSFTLQPLTAIRQLWWLLLFSFGELDCIMGERMNFDIS